MEIPRGKGWPKTMQFPRGWGALRLVSYQKLTAALSSKVPVNLLLTTSSKTRIVVFIDDILLKFNRMVFFHGLYDR